MKTIKGIIYRLFGSREEVLPQYQELFELSSSQRLKAAATHVGSQTDLSEEELNDELNIDARRSSCRNYPY